MSCIVSSPLPELATKDSIDRLEARMELLATKDSVDRLEARMELLATKDDLQAGLDKMAAMREADRADFARQFRWLIGTLIACTGVIIGAMYGIVSIT